ncbi:MAG TPA: ABC transporter permease [Tepidisphaeraceae bacterium]|nr:ABC transporter permease [Tepidisphaeraceae bacterium]
MLLWLLLFVVAPTVILLIHSFFRGGEMSEVEFSFTLDNYRNAFGVTYLRIFLRSLLYASFTTILCVVIGYPVAYFIGRSGPRWRNALLLLVTIPFLTSFLIRAYAWFIILRDHGVLNAFLQSARVIPWIVPHRLELLYTPFAVIIGLVYTYLPFMILPIYGSVEKLDNTLLEAASDLGAGPLQTAWGVILPLTWPGVAAGITLVFVPSVAMFAVTSIMSGGHILLIGDVIQGQFGAAGNLPFGAALGILLLFLFMLSFVLVQRKLA